MRQLLERLISVLTVLLAVFAVAQLADAQTLPDPDSLATRIARFELHQSFQACGDATVQAASTGW